MGLFEGFSKHCARAVFFADAISSMPKFVESAKRDTWKKTRSKSSKKPILLNVKSCFLRGQAAIFFQQSVTEFSFCQLLREMLVGQLFS